MHRRPSLTVSALALVVTLVGSGCSQDEENPASEPNGDTTVTSSPLAPSSSSSSSSPPSPAPAPPSTQTSPSRSSELPQVPRTSPAPPFIAGATWGESDYGVTLKVAPSAAGRQAWGADDSQLAWQEVLRLFPDADTPGMWEQFDCHWTWARILEPGKATWNLEPWRPVVSPERMLAEGCNPGGPEV